jgi:hypothetical protein
MASKTSEFYKKNPESRKKRNEDQARINKEKRKDKRKSHKTGKMIQYASDLKNREREAKKNGQDTSKTDYDHDDKKRIPKRENRVKGAKKGAKRRKKKVRLKVKKKK